MGNFNSPQEACVWVNLSFVGGLGFVILSITKHKIHSLSRNQPWSQHPRHICPPFDPLRLGSQGSQPFSNDPPATGLVAYKAYTCHGFMKATLGLGQLKVTTVLMVVTESGAAYCIIQAINMALDFTDNTNGSPQFSGSSPHSLYLHTARVARLWCNVPLLA
ncbi:hypothetical protein B0H10DRAFT_1950200 [Mycena sp. CBHHK59/15]|nr:hypothetical protein B0H10DRAFT_1950200 [Mycena sp. CBHHK59/15]